MNHNDPLPTCTADDEGRPCPRVAVMLRPVALCHAHRVEVALTVVPDLLREQLDAALRGTATPPAVRTDLIETARIATVDDLLHGVHDSIVYFIANGGRIKIGYTTNLKGRLSALTLRRDAVLLALHGGPELERALHTHFARHRRRDTEWFELSPELLRYIASPHPNTTGIPHACNSAATATTRLLTADDITDLYGLTTPDVQAMISPAFTDPVRGAMYNPEALFALSDPATAQ